MLLLLVLLSCYWISGTGLYCSSGFGALLLLLLVLALSCLC
jgi:hypothetical protein